MARAGYIKAQYKGIRERSSDFRYETFAGLFLPLPPLSEQRAIVAYIERKERQIDTYIARQAEQIERLKELRQTIISHAVTRGIHPYTRFRPTGIPWIPEVPKHWEVRMLSQLAKEHYKSNKDVHNQNLLSLSYGRIINKDINRQTGLTPASYDTYQIVENGNIVLRLTDLQNDQRSLRVGLCTQEGIITSAYLALEARESMHRPFLYLLLHVTDLMKVFYCMGNGLRQNLNWGELRKLLCILPPLSEQRAIVAYIEKKTATVDRMINACREQTELMKAYKQRLISDAVTGRINVLPHD